LDGLNNVFVFDLLTDYKFSLLYGVFESEAQQLFYYHDIKEGWTAVPGLPGGRSPLSSP